MTDPDAWLSIACVKLVVSGFLAAIFASDFFDFFVA